MIIYAQCWQCQKTFSLEVPEKGYKAWMNGELIQNAMPKLSAADRELLVSKTCTPCWDKMFGGSK